MLVSIYKKGINMNEGIVYIMTTVMEGLIKIGIAEEKQYNERMRFLESNGYRQINGLKRYFAIKVSDYKAKEKLLQDVFFIQKLGDTELFSLEPELARRLLTAFEGTIIYPEIKDKEKEFAKLAETSEQNNRFSFTKKGLKNGDIITFIKDKNITAIVEGENKVKYNGDIWKLSPLVRKLFEDRGEVNKSGAYQGAAYFEYKGKKLKDLPDIC
jgi:hypothetical protein